MPRYASVLLFALLLQACGVIYTVPRIDDDAAENFSIVELDSDTVKNLNASQYKPRQLPAFFNLVPSSQPPSGKMPRGVNPPPAFTPQPYQLGTGDEITLNLSSTVSAFANPSGGISQSTSVIVLTVQADGTVSIPENGRIKLAGLTFQQAEAAIFNQFVENSTNPSFSIQISGFNSQFVTVGGNVSAHTVVPISLVELTLDKAITIAGGPDVRKREFSTISINRDGRNYNIPLSKFSTSSELKKLPLKAGDSITIRDYSQLDTKSLEIANQQRVLSEQRQNFAQKLEIGAVPKDFVYLTGEVITPSRFALPFERQASLADALYESGGFSTITADPSQIYVIRSNGSGKDSVSALHLDASRINKLVLATQLHLRPNDIIFIAQQPVTNWNRALQQLQPTIAASNALKN